MAANRGVTVFVLLLYCCHRAEQPARNTSGTVTVDRWADEILVQEILNPNKSSRAETSRTAATISTTIPKRKGPRNHQPPTPTPGSDPRTLGLEELAGMLSLQTGGWQKVSSANDSYQVSGPEEYEKNNSKINHHEHLSILDKILKKIGKFSGNLSRKLKKTKEARRAESGQHDHKLREISVKQEILTE
ncbi:sperm acrosome-associated protein 7-like [Molossus molossus]|uniref:sperm acrosome-associated protein 7-like n=1 Tax=Molossus molossus TaxID=27622 RepID=UPI001746EA94|nr:sperm acrosome-associated protein 7-like [Molossus molossus]